MKFGLLGRKLGHSYSPMIFDLMGGYRYDLFEREPEGIEDLLRNTDFDGINVTIPYKMRFCSTWTRSILWLCGWVP